MSPLINFDKPIILTSPPTKYPAGKVKLAQKVLTTNVFGTDFGPGPIDDQMGVNTRAAIIRAKTALGYPTTKINGVFGEELFVYLLGTKKLSKAYVTTRNQRLAAITVATTIKLKALELSLKDLGVHEDPAGSNLQPYGKKYGFNGVAWCAIFFTCKQLDAGDKTGLWALGRFTAAVQDVYNAASIHSHGLGFTSNPEPGDAVIYNTNEHIERFQSWFDRANGTFYAVGGNTSNGDGSYSNGGVVARNLRSTRGERHVVFVSLG